MSNYRDIRDKFERLTSAHPRGSPATRAPRPSELGFRLPGEDLILPDQHVICLPSWVQPFEGTSAYWAAVVPEYTPEYIARVMAGDVEGWIGPPAHWYSDDEDDDPDQEQAFVPAQEQAPVPVRMQEQDPPFIPPPPTTVLDPPSPPATPLNHAPTPTTPPLDVLALEELVHSMQAEVETLVRTGAKCDRGFRGLGLGESEQGQGMGKGAKKLHGQQQLEELLHLVEVEELEELEEPLPVGQTSGRARCSAGHKVWNPGGSQR